MLQVFLSLVPSPPPPVPGEAPGMNHDESLEALTYREFEEVLFRWVSSFVVEEKIWTENEKDENASENVNCFWELAETETDFETGAGVEKWKWKHLFEDLVYCFSSFVSDF